MYKKFIKFALLTSTLTISSTVAFANETKNHFDGGIIGLNFGIGGGKLNTEYFDNSTAKNVKKDLAYVGGTAGLVVGYGQTFGNLFLGGELSLDARSMRRDETHTLTSGGVVWKERSSGKNTAAYGFALRPGFLVTDQTMLFALVGLEQNRFEFNHTATRNSVQFLRTNKAKWLNSYKFGGGLEHALDANPNLKFRTEYTYTMVDEFKIGSGVNAVKFNPDMHLVKFGLGYSF